MNFTLPSTLSIMVSAANWSEQLNYPEIELKWQALFRQIQTRLPESIKPQLITGYREGIEQLSVELAHQNQFKIQLLLCQKFGQLTKLVKDENRLKIDRIVSLGRGKDELMLLPSPQQTRDRLMLDYADILLIAWRPDLNSEESKAGFELISQAAQSLKPVIWLDPNGELHWLKLNQLDNANLLILKAENQTTERLLSYFKTFSSLEQTPFAATLSQLFLLEENPDPLKQSSINQLLGTENSIRTQTSERSAKTGFWFQIKQKFDHFKNPMNLSPTNKEIQAKTLLTDAFSFHNTQAEKAGDAYRYNVWMLYGFAALAVILAVSAEVWQLHWLAYFELIVIATIIYRVYWARKIQLHENWMRHRYIAEQLRYCIMGYPLMVVPDPFRAAQWQVKNNQLMLKSAEIWLIQRYLMASGLPCEDGKIYTPPYHNHALVEHMQRVIDNQKTYHQRHHHQKHLGHHRLHRATEIFFVFTFIAVSIHLFVHDIWLLLFTAALPAVAASLHGILTKLEMQRIASQSAQLYQQLDESEKAFKRFIEGAKEGDDDWHQWLSLYALASSSEKIMSDNIKQWQHLIQKQSIDIPV
ncbi:hypothetical protein JX580_00770 [Thiomicrospira microaerophila]|uniref:DUF4231 domain-containing protein n=1 Tax=Thiomicrospira microaerophila TaxID=406020 RepID=UPI002010AE66|nr:hypothetical protein [Thiomicrospira microaerophila]UQB42482.1 hypothetical protein JX580_00770 [Thiomicrospira microaerophila]